MLSRRLFFALLGVVWLAPLAQAAPPTPVTTSTPAATVTALGTPTPAPTATASTTGTPATTGTPTATATPVAPTLTAAAYRARLVNARDGIVKQRPPVNATKFLKGLSSDVLVKRSDGATQLVHGDAWAEWLSNTRSGNANAAQLTGHQARELQNALDDQLKLFDEWNGSNGRTLYQPATNAQAIVKQLEDSGQIRTGPLWWQSFYARAKNWLSQQFQNFVTWLGSLLPKRAPSASIPDLRWLLWVFWIAVLAIIGVILYFLYRAFGGLLGLRFSWWSFGRRKRVKPVAFEGEDAELLLLPPDELRQRAENYAAQGNFREALRHRFIALLLHLDQRGVWRYDIRRTNWEHIGALRREEAQRALVDPISDLTQRFDRVRYGGAECSENEWSRFERDVQGLENQIVTQKVAVAEVAR